MDHVLQGFGAVTRGLLGAQFEPSRLGWPAILLKLTGTFFWPFCACGPSMLWSDQSSLGAWPSPSFSFADEEALGPIVGKQLKP